MLELKYKDVTEKIIGASFEVHKFLGNGFQEVIYQRALAWEFAQAGLSYTREIEQEIFLQRANRTNRYKKSRFRCRRKSFSGVKSTYRIGRCTPCTSIKLPESL